MTDEPGSGADGAVTFRTSDHGRFTDWLREGSEPHWTRAVDHRFVDELAADELDDDVFRRYLVQDYAFVETLASAVGHAAGQAPTIEASGELAGFLGTIASDEDDYFERSFDALGVAGDRRRSPERTEVTEAFCDLLLRAALEGGYADSLAVLLPVEWVYLEWASARADAAPERFYLEEWIDLHAGADFEAFVGWLREELDAYGAELPERRQRRIQRHFRRAVALEVAFFQSAYEGPGAGGRSW